MKKRLVSLLSLVLVIVMVLAMAISCGKEETPNDNKTPSDSNNGTTQKPDEGNKPDPIVPVEKNWYDDLDFGGQTLTIQLSGANDPELPVVKEYIKGPDVQTAGDTGTEKVQNEVYLRNRTVMGKSGLNLDVQYRFVEGKESLWGSVGPYIVRAERNYDSSDKIDMYCDMLYDMMGAACEKGVFDNILNYTTANGGYFNISRINGYNVALMEDMSLTSDRQALIASDYYLDVLRAMTILPFNLEMYTNYANPNDKDAKGLYQMALDGEWTWDKLMSFDNVASSSGATSINDDRILIPLACGGLTASALLYSTAYDMYEVTGDGYYKLLTTCTPLWQLFEKAGDLAIHHGVTVIQRQTGEEETATVERANAKFTSGGSLFATVNMLGILETNDFQNMGAGKLSIMPVPKLNDGSEYSTMINSRARVGALSYNSKNQVAMSAFIQLSTEKSEGVKQKYFDVAMNGKYLAGSGAGDVLTMVYNNLGNTKGAILDNLVLYRNWSIGRENCWTQLIKGDGFRKYATSIQSQYASSIQAKQTVLDDAVDAWMDCARG